MLKPKINLYIAKRKIEFHKFIIIKTMKFNIDLNRLGHSLLANGITVAAVGGVMYFAHYMGYTPHFCRRESDSCTDGECCETEKCCDENSRVIEMQPLPTNVESESVGEDSE